jgi:hypothetical protein
MSDNTQRKTSREYLADAYALADQKGLMLTVETSYQRFDEGHVVFTAKVNLDERNQHMTFTVRSCTGHKIIHKDQIIEDFTACETMAVGRACMFPWRN